ncbi:MAG: hypothetical protein AB7O24_04760 [Kofleriaceae bacterium]
MLVGYSATFVKAEIWVDSSRLHRVFEDGNHDGIAGFCENAAFYTGLEFELDDDDNICAVTYECDKHVGEVDEYLDAIAPATKPGSFIELCGDDGSTLRYDFDGTRCSFSHGLVPTTSRWQWLRRIFLVLRPRDFDSARRARRAEREARERSATSGNASEHNEAIGDGSRARCSEIMRSEH